ncbi:hypothetical protein AGR1A_Cc20123 [Agrobacterium fabacearum CFBP 5771]|uniref:hypothetical protein n=1 Tax=Agrobacterium tumefaciens TaxID=358 RepID=UPI0004709B19|nr:hypothetical protein [Agrobacterium tumefaciens]CVI14862.1 hypothetical protein AGR1A_Cc20123 [Agrobacterium fabacearum CFBP 5771]
MKTAPAIHPDISRQLNGGKDLISEVDRLAGELANLMQEIHGRTWRIQIEHSDDVAFVMVVPRLDKRRAAA